MTTQQELAEMLAGWPEDSPGVVKLLLKVEERDMAVAALRAQEATRQVRDALDQMAASAPTNIGDECDGWQQERERLRKKVNQLQARLHCMCGSPMDHSPWEGHSPVSMYDYALDQANERIAELEKQVALTAQPTAAEETLMMQGFRAPRKSVDTSADTFRLVDGFVHHGSSCRTASLCEQWAFAEIERLRKSPDSGGTTALAGAGDKQMPLGPPAPESPDQATAPAAIVGKWPSEEKIIRALVIVAVRDGMSPPLGWTDDEVITLATQSDWRLATIQARAVLALLPTQAGQARKLVRDAIIACLQIVENEPEAETPPTAEQVALMEAAGVISITRASIRATKKAIHANILKLLQERLSSGSGSEGRLRALTAQPTAAEETLIMLFRAPHDDGE